MADKDTENGVYASLQSLIAPVTDLPDGEDVTLPSGAVVRVRGLTRRELMATGKGTDDPIEVEARTVSTCMIEPRMTINDVKSWQNTHGSIRDIAAVTVAIRDQSGLGEGADKSSLAETGD